MPKPRPMKPLTSKYMKLMLTSLNLIHCLQNYDNYCREWRPFWILPKMMVPVLFEIGSIKNINLKGLKDL